MARPRLAVDDLAASGYGPARARAILTQPDTAEILQAVVSTVRQAGAGEGYQKYFSRSLKQLNIAFLTKLLYFAAYQFPGYPTKQHPRPLIYDRRVAATITRLPGAPLLPTIGERVSHQAYGQYCSWAEQTAIAHHIQTVVVEHAPLRTSPRAFRLWRARSQPRPAHRGLAALRRHQRSRPRR
jgi:hypothetical protein